MRDVRRHAIPVVIVLVFLLGSSIASVRQTASVGSFERYAAGEFDAAVTALIRDRSIDKVVSDLKRDGQKWIGAATPDLKPRRLAVVAALAVEVMAESLARDIHEYRNARELIDWACGELRRLPPSAFERQFHLASIALMQGSREEGLWSGLKIEDHAVHAGTRYPDEGRFKLAFVTRRLSTQWVATWPVSPGYLTREQPTSWGQDTYLDETQADLAKLFTDPAVEHEARLRSGVMHFLRDQPAAARSDLGNAVAASDPAVRYVAHLVLGAIDDQAGRSSDAIGHYGLAHRDIPASASSIALAGALYRSGRLAEAAQVLASYEKAPPPPDPWRLYSQRDYRLFDAFRGGMRKAVLR